MYQYINKQDQGIKSSHLWLACSAFLSAEIFGLSPKISSGEEKKPNTKLFSFVTFITSAIWRSGMFNTHLNKHRPWDKAKVHGIGLLRLTP